MVENIAVNESSKLYHLEPSVNNNLQESLTSYISRLANKHLMDVNQLINYEMVPILQKEYLNRIALYGGTRFYNNASMLNGVGKAAFEFVEALQTLTLRTDLFNCTLYSWRDVIPTRGLISSIKKWCPICYHEALEKSEEIYDPLIWSLQSVNTCFKHKINLIYECPNCKQKLRILDRYSQPGFCNKCKHWLGNTSAVEASNEYDIEITRQVVNLLRAREDACVASSKNIVEFFKQCAESFSGGIAEFSRFTGMPKTTVWGWFQGKSLPSLSNILAVCILLKVDLLDVLLGLNLNLNIDTSMKNSKYYRPRKVKQLNQKELEQILNNHITNTQITPSLQQIAKKEKIPKKLLSKYQPALCKLIVDKYALLKKSEAVNKMVQRKIEIHKICDWLINQGIYPSRRRVEGLATWKAALRNTEIQKEWKQIINGCELN